MEPVVVSERQAVCDGHALRCARIDLRQCREELRLAELERDRAVRELEQASQLAEFLSELLSELHDTVTS